MPTVKTQGQSMGFRSYLQHHLNAAHVSCRLLDAGFPAFIVFPLCRAWEWLSHPLFYPGARS